MLSRSLRSQSAVLVSAGALLFACSSRDDKPGNTSHAGGSSGSDNAAGSASKSGTGGTETEGGSANHAGMPGEGGKSQGSAGAASDGGSGDSEGGGGEPSTGGDDTPPTLEGDGITWTWSGKTYTVNKKMYAGFFNSGANVNISGSDSDESPAPNMFNLHLMPNEIGTFQCKDYVTALASSFGIVWQTFDKTANPPNPSFAYAQGLPCELTVTRADKGDTAGDVFEGTFRADLRFPGNGVYPAQDRKGIVGTMRWTKK